jgi:hypothetical protein
MIYFEHLDWRSLSLIVIFISNFFVLSTLPQSAEADDLNPGVYAIDSKPFGKSYGEWIAGFFNWTAQIPAQVHPTSAYTPEICSINQNGPVWFLAEAFEGTHNRTCTIPSDKAILLPTMSGIEWTDSADNPPRTYEEMLGMVMSGNEEYVEFSAKLDGREIKNLDKYRAQSPLFDLKMVENNIWDGRPGVWKAVADGYFVFLEPLSVGNHTLETIVDVSDPRPDKVARNYAAIITYNLNIVESSKSNH